MPAAKSPIAGTFVPSGATLPQLRDAVQHCQGCDLYRHATQAVFGEGPRKARIVMVGEQPGDQEDRAGRPFVGPAGKLLSQALDDSGIPREDVYITNAVKHFKFEARGKRRLHKKPSATEIVACQPWLNAELAVVQPELIVCLGATAVRAVIGPGYHLLKERGHFLDHAAARSVTATIHPSAILRSPDAAQRRTDYEAFVRDLKAVRRKLDQSA
jgi:uracil-DNA glycosylase